MPDNITTDDIRPADYHGYLALLLVDGDAPNLYRIDRTTDGGCCEDCGNLATERPGSYYRWIELHDTAWPLHLGVCHQCLTNRYWDKRLRDDEPADGVGDRMHIYSPVDPTRRPRG